MATLWGKDEQHLDGRYATGGYLFGTQPNPFLLSLYFLTKYCISGIDNLSGK